MSRRVGWYSAKFNLDSIPEIVYYNGFHCIRTGLSDRMPDEFCWISDKPIVPEEPPVKMVIGSWYMFKSIHGDTMVGQYDITEYHGIHLRLGKDSWYPVDKVKIIGGPFTTEELSQRK